MNQINLVAAIVVLICFANFAELMELHGVRHKREAVAEITVEQCRSIGRNCGIIRDEVIPSTVKAIPCCENLVCLGASPLEITNGVGMAHHSDELVTAGICSLNLDNNQATKDKDTYLASVK